MTMMKEMLELFRNDTGDFTPRRARIIEVHGRPVRCIHIYDQRAANTAQKLFLMIEQDGRTWLWDGMVDP